MKVCAVCKLNITPDGATRRQPLCKEGVVKIQDKIREHDGHYFCGATCYRNWLNRKKS